VHVLFEMSLGLLPAMSLWLVTSLLHLSEVVASLFLNANVYSTLTQLDVSSSSR
jgi:hypothetical protein